MPWETVGLTAAEEDLPVAVGGSDAPHRLLEAHRHGAFPHRRLTDVPGNEPEQPYYRPHIATGLITAFPVDAVDTADPEPLTWWNPPQRPVIEVGASGLADTLRGADAGGPRWIVTCNQAFAEVVNGCRDPAVAGWITDAFRASVVALHHAGWSHSVEIWYEGRLIAGLFGTGIGEVFSVDAAFGSHPGATCAAFADLSRRLRGRARFIDFQVPGADAKRCAARLVSRSEYLDALLQVDLPLVILTDVLTVQPVPHGSTAL